MGNSNSTANSAAAKAASEIKKLEAVTVLDWVLDDFISLWNKKGDDKDELWSPQFQFDVEHESGTKSSWGLRLSVIDDGMIQLVFVEVSQEILIHPGTKCNLTISLGNNMYPVLLKRDTGVRAIERKGTKFNTFNVNLMTFRELQGKMLWGQNKLRIQIMMTILDGEAFIINAGKGLDMGLELLKDPEFSDVLFRCGEHKINAHKNILACRSPVFRKMFTADMCEAASGVVQVDDLDLTVFNLILQYIYTGEVTKLDPELALEVIYGAEKYGLEKLKKYCFAKLVECISDENVGALAVAAHLYRAQPRVVNAIQEYLNRDFVTKVRADRGLYQLVKQYPDAFFSTI